MLSVFSVLFVIAFITAALLAGEVFAQKSRAMNALRQWQTYLAALVGLTAIIVSIAIPEELAKARDNKAKEKLENAYLIDLATRLGRFEDDVRAHSEVVKKAMQDGADVNNCLSAFSALSSFPINTSIQPPSAFELQNLSSQTYFNLSNASDLQSRYVRAISATSSSDCYKDPTAILGYMSNVHETWLPIVKGTRSSLQ